MSLYSGGMEIMLIIPLIPDTGKRCMWGSRCGGKGVGIKFFWIVCSHSVMIGIGLELV